MSPAVNFSIIKFVKYAATFAGGRKIKASGERLFKTQPPSQSERNETLGSASPKMVSIDSGESIMAFRSANIEPNDHMELQLAKRQSSVVSRVKKEHLVVEVRNRMLS